MDRVLSGVHVKGDADGFGIDEHDPVSAIVEFRPRPTGHHGQPDDLGCWHPDTEQGRSLDQTDASCPRQVWSAAEALDLRRLAGDDPGRARELPVGDAPQGEFQRAGVAGLCPVDDGGLHDAADEKAAGTGG